MMKLKRLKNTTIMYDLLTNAIFISTPLCDSPLQILFLLFPFSSSRFPSLLLIFFPFFSFPLFLTFPLVTSFFSLFP